MFVVFVPCLAPMMMMIYTKMQSIFNSSERETEHFATQFKNFTTVIEMRAE